MKNYIILVIALVFTFSTKAQEDKKPQIYFQTGFSFGSQFGGKFSLNYTNSNNLTFSFGTRGSSANALEKPDDYSAGLFGIFSGYDRYTHYFATIGTKYFFDKEKGYAWNLKGGLAYSQVTNAINFTPVEDYIG
ncbi:MAG: hypothetical protein N4A45_04310 [Flavobacteriales bacterium]|jgi:hypothetical protein|nr:hypothetical protein [Flavobacteriales bacterium]